ncbi:MAG: acyltransferase domain-containing protein [Betaproteobacteria bacterium]|nr:MAG: acyltransferase domain-containing protein [Betaproteobacteria bacterium]
MSSAGHPDYGRVAEVRPVRPWHFLVLSAKSQASLEAATRNLAEHLQRYPDLDIVDVAFTLQAGRPLFKHRRTVVCRDLSAAIAALQNSDHETSHTARQGPKQPPVAFVFSGETSSLNAVSRLHETEPVFAREIDRLADLLKPVLGLDLRQLLYSVPEPTAASSAMPDDPGTSAASVFAIEYALAKSWQTWGVTPAAVMGYGAGEYAAACIAGVMEPEQAASLALSRARVLSGALEQSAFAKVTKNLRLHPARLRCLSSITGDWLSDADAIDASYWLRQRQWTSTREVAVQTLVRDGLRVLLPVDPGNGLPHELTGEGDAASGVNRSLPVVPAGDPDLPRVICQALGRLYALGVAIDWSAYYTELEPHRVPLPSYPFERHRCWYTEGAMVARDDSPRDRLAADANQARHSETRETTTCAVPTLSADDHTQWPSDLEATLVDLCQNLLGIDDIGMNDNIIELGGDSLFLMQLSRHIGEVFGVQISPHHLFSKPNIASLAKKVRQIQPPAERSVNVPQRVAEQTPVSSSADMERYQWILSLVEKLPDAEVESILRRMND